MNGTTGGRRALRRAGALAVMAAVAVLTVACGVHISFGTAPAGSADYRANLAYAHCMRAHGAPDFPIPAPGDSFHISGHPRHGTVLTARARANEACERLLPPGSVTADSTSR